MGNVQREEQILKEGLAILILECAPRRVYLFGSRAKKQARPGSDFDFAVEGPVPNILQKTKTKGQYLATIAMLVQEIHTRLL